MKEKKYEQSFRERLCCGFANGGLNVVTILSATFITGYYTDSAGISAVAVGTMMLICRFLDGVSDLIMGRVIDSTHSKFGKGRAWLLRSTPFVAIGLILLLSVPSSWGEGAKLVYAYVTYIFMMVFVYTAYAIAVSVYTVRFSLNSNDRVSVQAMGTIISYVIALSISAITIPLTAAVGWQMTGIVYAIVMIIVSLIAVLGAKEHVGNEAEVVQEEKVPLAMAVKSLRENKFFIPQAILLLLFVMTTSVVNAMTYYYAGSVMNNLNAVGLLSVASMIPSIIIAFVIPTLANRFGKFKLCIAAFAIMGLGFLTVGLSGANLIGVLIGTVFKGIGSGLASCVFIVTADIVDYGEWKSGIRADGLISSVTSFGQKVGTGLGSAIAVWMIGLAGYDGLAEVQSAQTIATIKFAFSYFGVILCVVLIIIQFFINLDRTIDQVQSDLAKKNAEKSEKNIC